MREIFKDIPEYEGLYQVSNFGNVKSVSRKQSKTERILKPTISAGGYYRVILCNNGKRKTMLIHQLVSIAFLNHVICGMKLVINHKDFNKTNNNVSNLEIATHRENSNRKHIKSSSKYTGVYWSKQNKKWVSQIVVSGKLNYLGSFDSEGRASIAYQFGLFQLDKLKAMQTQ